jgi:cytochrome P450
LQTLRYGFDPEGFFAAGRRRYGDVFTARVLAETWVVLSDPGAVQEVFAQGPEQVNSGEANFALRPLIGTRNVLLLDGPEHLARRKLVLPPFHGDRMRAYESTIRAAIAAEIAAWPLDEPAAVLPRMQALTFSVIMSSVFGLGEGERLQVLGTALRQMLAWVTDMRRALFFATFGPERLMRLPGFRRQVEVVEREIEAEIAQRRSATDLGAREDILSLLLQARDEEGRGLTDAELRDELVTLLVAGHETTATLIAWAAHELAREPDSQQRLAAEAAAGESAFADAALSETLRLRPPIPVVLRRLREPLRIAGHELPAGTTVAPCTLLVHRRPDLYPDPWRFRPERFLDHRPSAGEWFPFGGAVRRCVGAAFARFEARIVLGELFGALRFEPDRRRPEPVGRRGPVLVPARGACVLATRR